MTDTLKNSKLARFMAIGGINTLIDFGLLFALTKLGLPVIVANTISTTVAFIFSFFMNKKYTFKTTDTNIKREVVLFVAFTLFGLWVLQNAVIIGLKPLVTSFGFSDSIAALIAKIPATIISMAWNYLTYDRFVFKRKSS